MSNIEQKAHDYVRAFGKSRAIAHIEKRISECFHDNNKVAPHVGYIMPQETKSYWRDIRNIAVAIY